MASSQPALSASARPAFAGLARRIAAYLLDLLIALSVLVLVAITFRLLRAIGLWTPAGAGAYFSPEDAWRALGVGAKLAIVFSFVLSQGAAYLILFDASPWQATFGKRLLNVYVTDDEGRRISLVRSFGRWFAMWAFGLFGGSFISLVTIAATRNKKALHDFAAKTLVVSGRPALSGELEPWRAVIAFGLPFVWMMGTFLATM